MTSGPIVCMVEQRENKQKSLAIRMREKIRKRGKEEITPLTFDKTERVCTSSTECLQI